MLPLWSLPALALIFTILAAAVAALRRIERRRILADAAAGLAAAAASVAPGVSFYWFDARNAGGACFLAFPLLSTAALRTRRGGSTLGTLLGSSLSVLLAAAWVTFYLKGPRGGWAPLEVVLCVSSILVAYAAAACLGWWCGRHA